VPGRADTTSAHSFSTLVTMQPVTRLVPLAATTAALVMLLGACGGDSDGGTVLDTPSTTAVPDSVVDSTEPTIPVESSVVVETTSTTTTVVETTTTTGPRAGQGVELTDTAKVSTIGLGPIFVGDLLTTVEEKLGVTLLVDETRPVRDACRYLLVPGGPPGVSVMAAFDRVARIDIDSPSAITTRSGARIGSTKDEIVGLFGAKIQVSAAAADDGSELLTFVPVDEKDQNLRIVFETNSDGVVVRYRTGQLPEVDLAGC